MKASQLSIEKIFDLVTNKVLGASSHCQMWATLHNIIGHEMTALRELEDSGLLSDAGPLLELSSGAHQVAMTMSVCSLYERPEKEDCVTLQVYRDKISEKFEIPKDIDDRISEAYIVGRKLYLVRTDYFAHGLAKTCLHNIFKEVGLSENDVIALIAETNSIVTDLARIEGITKIDLRIDVDVTTRLSRVNLLLLKFIESAK